MYKLVTYEATCLAQHSVRNSGAKPGSSPGWDWTPTIGTEARAQVPSQDCLQCCKELKLFDIFQLPALSQRCTAFHEAQQLTGTNF